MSAAHDSAGVIASPTTTERREEDSAMRGPIRLTTLVQKGVRRLHASYDRRRTRGRCGEHDAVIRGERDADRARLLGSEDAVRRARGPDRRAFVVVIGFGAGRAAAAGAEEERCTATAAPRDPVTRSS